MRHSSYLEINLSLLAQNMEKIKKLAPRSEILPMVKADAYGNGLVPISRFLVEGFGAKTLGCASLGEAIKLFQDCPGLPAEVLVFSDTEIHNEDLRKAYLELPITPVIHQKSDLEILMKDSSFNKVPLVIKLNTGMNRLGMTLPELESAIPHLKKRGVDHLITHFASSYFPLKEKDKTYRQYEEFKKAQSLLKDSNVEVKATSVANSGAIEQGFGVEETYVRPGLMMYGPYSVEPRIWDGHQISRLVTKVLKTFSVKRGTPVGYGVNVTNEDCFMAIIALGYGDGLMTWANGIKITVNGFEGQLFARVNMDMAFIKFDMSVEGKIKAEDKLEIWNNDNQIISDLATQMKTIPYQLMCGISGRIPRIYKVN